MNDAPKPAGDPLQRIGDLCLAYVRCRERRDDVVEQVHEARRKIVRAKMRSLKSVVAHEAAALAELRAAIEENPEVFEKPKTRIIEGVKVGYRKQPGKIEVADTARTIRLIRQKLADRWYQLVVEKQTLDLNAMKKLTVKELASVGATLTDDTDEIVTRAASTDLDKLVDVLMGELEEAA